MHHNLSLLSLSKVLLFLLIVSINLREPYLHSREILFCLFVAVSWIYGNYRKISSMFILLSIWSISFLYNALVPGSNALNGHWYETVINSVYLFLLVFSNKTYYRVIIKSFVFSAVIVSVLTVGLWLICYNNSVIRDTISSYFDNMMIQKGITVLRIDSRYILDYPFFFLWYRTSPIIIPALGYLLIQRLRGYTTFCNFCGIILFSLALILSGTRANMLCAVLLLFFFQVFKLFKKNHYIIATAICILTVSSGIYVANKFLTDKRSTSTHIKHLDQEAYFKTYETDYVRTFLFGWGCGSTFYSPARRMYLELTELSHWETIRRYGVISFLLIMIFIWLRPLIKKFRYERGISKYFYVSIVLAYIFTACTNPFLLDSLGFCVLLFFDAFFEYDTIYCVNNVQRRKLSLRAA